jgi:serine/threonine protein kinase
MCRMHDVGNTGSHYCLVMPQYVETMQGWCARLQKAPVAPPVMLRLALTRLIEIVSALQGLHDRRIVHGDLKADNVFLDNSDAIAIGDFGDCEFVVRSEIRAAAAGGGASATTGRGEDSEQNQRTSLLPAMLGTEAIRAPELVVPHRYNDRRKRQSTATRYLRDVWSVGCLLYELLTGQMLFGAEDAGEMLHRITDESAPLIGKEQRRELQHALGHHSESMLDAALAHVEQLLSFVVVRDPTRRPSLREVKSKMAETLHRIPSAPVRSLGLPSTAHAALRPAWIGNTPGAQQVSWVTFAASINWDVARTDAQLRRLAPASTRVPLVAEGALSTRPVQSRRGTVIDTPAPSSARWADSATASIRRCFGVVHPGLLLTAQPGQPSLHALSTVRATHLVSFVAPLSTVANAMPCFSLAGAVTALFPDIDSRDAAQVNGFAGDADDDAGPDSGLLAGGDVSLRSDNSEAQGRKLAAESGFAAHIKAAVDFITVAHVTRGTTVITSFIVDTVDIGLVLALVFITKTYGIAPCNALPFTTLLVSAVRPSGFEQSLDYGLTVALAERCLMFLVVPDCAPSSPDHVFHFNVASAASLRGPAYGGRTTSRYQCVCASHVWRLPAEALTSNVVIDAPSSRLIPGDVLPRMTIFALIANLTALYAPAFVQTLFDSGSIHVATMSRFDVSNIGIQQLIPQGPSIRIRHDAEGALVFCRECGLPMIYVPADGSDAGRTFGLVMLCLLPHAGHDVRSDLRQSSWLGKMPAALSQAASFAMH